MSSEWVVRLDGLEQNFDVDITRRGKWGNPFVVGVHGTRQQCIELHKRWINGHIKGPNGEQPPAHEEIRAELKSKRLGCHCAPNRCHGDYLALIANEPIRRGLFKGLNK